MAAVRHVYVVMYDISSPRSLRRVHRILTEWGAPVQYSVFRVRATMSQFEQLRYELVSIVAPTDRLFYVRLCRGCAGRATGDGRPLAEWTVEAPDYHID